jgi:hypothetical protein
MPHVRQFLDVSTAHLTPECRRWLDNEAEDGPTYSGCYGYVTWACVNPDDHAEVMEDEDRPDVLTAIFQRAASLGCDYVLFDRDAEEDEALPVFDDDGEPMEHEMVGCEPA